MQPKSNDVVHGPIRCSIDAEIILSRYAQPLKKALDAYKNYARQANRVYLKPRQAAYEDILQADHKTAELLSKINFKHTLDAIESAISQNAQIAEQISAYGYSQFKDILELDQSVPVSDFDCSVVRGCIRSTFRDWTVEGTPERMSAHGPILQAIKSELKSQANPRVLVPGAGLGRLVYSIYELGCSVEWNDISCHTLLASLYMFSSQDSHVLYPWALSFSNHLKRKHQFQSVVVPDINPGSTLEHQAIGGQSVHFRLGHFVETYGAVQFQGYFSALGTCYFIDTATNFLEYVDTAWSCLQPGGMWVNVGPLLWNTEENGPAGDGQADMDGQDAWMSPDQPNCSRLELTGEEVLVVLQAKGFIIEQASDEVGRSMYVGNENSLLEYTYKMVFWVARKPAE